MKFHRFEWLISFIVSVAVAFGQDTNLVQSSPSSDIQNYMHTARHIRVYGGMALPLGKFGSTNESDSESGFAKSGPAFGFDLNINILDNLAYSMGGLITLNNISIPQSGTPEIPAGTGSHTGIWIINGLIISRPISETAYVHILAEAGILFIHTSDIRLINNGSNYGKNNPATTSALAYAVGVGMDIGRISINMRFGGSDPEYEIIHGVTVHQPTWCLVPSIGIAF